jgi:protoheme IX farnesyltransferase
MSLIKNWSNYIQLTKPRIMLLVLITGTTALIIEGSLVYDPLRFMLVLVGLYLTGGCANALNQYFELEIDTKMERTKQRRPLPQGKITKQAALIFSLAIGITGVLIFGLFFNWLTAGLSLFTILFYSLVYTLLLKPNTSQNIVIGGIAGAMAPVGAWAAASGRMDIVPWILFLIVFFWTPPHFWALALFYKDDYYRAELPMLPVVKGDEYTLKQIIFYIVIVLITSLSLVIIQASIFYLVIALGLGFIFLKKSLIAHKYRTEKQYKGLFGYSIIYLFVLFFTLIIDTVLQRFIG